ncbi:hypothetical protein BDP81DRAFT_1052 [Colletotrichum phormii]|uniref:Uncharacterized protein n=1 Tax=Colletotrichum phormii TaxID=359342 RepID=A0AAJ0A2E8_9PEZI|nr:uncharacterized protein BDP81DRAFT_1052 [Colletotrichum phormii]KAK1655220.1 hypothetical protein BDP81DRAFT_1052 [Colletotrichum phormii]
MAAGITSHQHASGNLHQHLANASMLQIPSILISRCSHTHTRPTHIHALESLKWARGTTLPMHHCTHLERGWLEKDPVGLSGCHRNLGRHSHTHTHTHTRLGSHAQPSASPGRQAGGVISRILPTPAGYPYSLSLSLFSSRRRGERRAHSDCYDFKHIVQRMWCFWPSLMRSAMLLNLTDVVRMQARAHITCGKARCLLTPDCEGRDMACHEQ